MFSFDRCEKQIIIKKVSKPRLLINSTIIQNKNSKSILVLKNYIIVTARSIVPRTYEEFLIMIL